MDDRVSNVINDNDFGLQDVYCHHLEPPSHYWTSAHLLVCSFVLVATFSGMEDNFKRPSPTDCGENKQNIV